MKLETKLGDMIFKYNTFDEFYKQIQEKQVSLEKEVKESREKYRALKKQLALIKKANRDVGPSSSQASKAN